MRKEGRVGECTGTRIASLGKGARGDVAAGRGLLRALRSAPAQKYSRSEKTDSQGSEKGNAMHAGENRGKGTYEAESEGSQEALAEGPLLLLLSEAPKNGLGLCPDIG